MMLSYIEMRDRLKASPEGIKLSYFTKTFYSTFLEARRTGEWEPVFSTDFYNRDGFGYCVFLEVFESALSQWELTFFKMDAGWPINIACQRVRADTEEDAKSIGKELLKRYGAEDVKVARIV